MKIKSWLHQVVITGCLLMAVGCATNGKDVSTTIFPNRNGDGVRAEIEIEYETIRELPKKLITGLGSALVSITQPIHPYHKRKSGKVWFPFWRIIGEHHGDSVVGIIYDHGWFGGWKEKPGDKLGKTAGLVLLIWGADTLTEQTNGSAELGSISEDTTSHESREDYDSLVEEHGPSIPTVMEPAQQGVSPSVPAVTTPSNPSNGNSVPATEPSVPPVENGPQIPAVT